MVIANKNDTIKKYLIIKYLELLVSSFMFAAMELLLTNLLLFVIIDFLKLFDLTFRFILEDFDTTFKLEEELA